MTAILDGTYPPGSPLPAERELATLLGVTRPTLREVLRRLERDGWITVRQGKSTCVNDTWREGGLNVLSTLVRYGRQLPPDFIPNLLEVRLALAPAYARAAVERDAVAVAAYLDGWQDPGEAAEPGVAAAIFAAFDWQLHRHLTLTSGNPIYTLILNGFAGFYEEMARLYFARPETQVASRAFYADLGRAAARQQAAKAERITRAVMAESLALWKSTVNNDQGPMSDKL